MSGMGRRFMIKRLAMGLSMGDAAKKAGVKTAVIRAIEEEDLLKFRDREAFIGQATAYAGVLNMDITEVARDALNLWLDSSSAKIYIQRKYNRKGLAAFFGENRMLAYGIVSGLVVAALSVGGYIYWNNLFEPGLPGELNASPVEESFRDTTTGPGDEGTGEFRPEASELAVDGSPAVEAEEAGAGPVGPPGSEEAVKTSIGGEEIFAAAGGVDEPVEGIDEAAPAEPAEAGNSADSALPEQVEAASTPRSGGNLYLLWSGLLTFTAGLALILLPAIPGGRAVNIL